MSKNENIFVLRWGQSSYEQDEDLHKERHGVEALGGQWCLWAEDVLPPDIGRADVLVVNSHVSVTRSVLDAFGGGLLLTTTSGVDHIDVAACRELGVAVARLAGARREAVAQYTLFSLLYLFRQMGMLQSGAREGQWMRSSLPELGPAGLDGRNILVVGLGVIGRRVSTLLLECGAKVYGCDPLGVPDGVESISLDSPLGDMDGVTLHCDLNDTSRNLFSESRLEKMKPGAMLVNTARGGLLDLEAGIRRVQTGALGGLAVDVFTEEPYTSMARQVSLPSVLFTPHSAGYTTDLGEYVTQGVLQAILAWSRDELPDYPVV